MPINNFNVLPVLSTERLTLRALSIDDQENIFYLRSDSQINKYLNRKPSKSIEDVTNFIHTIKNNKAPYWAITLTETGIFVGTIFLFNFSSKLNSCEIGYELLTKFQKQGIMIEAVERIIKYAFQTFCVQQLIAVTHKENLSSIKLLTKLNFIKSEETNSENPDCSIFILNNKTEDKLIL